MHKYDISVICPGIRTDTWKQLVASIADGIVDHSFEIIFVSPARFPDDIDDFFNIKYVRDYGSPSRAMQLGSTLAEGEFLTWVVDDGYVHEDCIDKEIERLRSFNDKKKIINFRYEEGGQWRSNSDPRIIDAENWFKPSYHDAFWYLDGIEEHWYTSLLFLMYTEYWNFLGGIDC